MGSAPGIRSIVVCATLVHALACSKPTHAGAGGAAGLGGTTDAEGGTGGDGEVVEDFDDPKIPDWLLDSSTWTLAPQRELWDDNCLLFEGKSDRLQFPPLEWKSCGDGCEQADLVQGFVNEHGFDAGYPRFGIARPTAGETPILQVSNYLDGDVRTVTVTRIINLESGVTLGAIKSSVPVNARVAYCYSEPPSGLSPSIGRIMGPGENATSFSATAFFHADSATWTWRLPFQLTSNPPSCTLGVMDDDDGKMFWICDGGLAGQLEAGSTQASLLLKADKNWSMMSPPSATKGKLLVWHERSTVESRGRVRSWSTEGLLAETVLEPTPIATCELSMDDRTLVGFYNENGYPCSIAPALYHFWWARRGEPSFSTTAAISAERVTSYGLTSRADFAAAQIYRDLIRSDGSAIERTDRVRIILLRFSDQAMRQFRPPPRMDFLEYFLSEKYLYVTYQSATNANLWGSTDEVFRYDLEKFDRIGLPHDGTLE